MQTDSPTKQNVLRKYFDTNTKERDESTAYRNVTKQS